MNRRIALKKIAAMSSVVPIIACGQYGDMRGQQRGMRGQQRGTTTIKSIKKFSQKDFIVPPLAKYTIKNNTKHFTLNMQKGSHNFIDKKTPTMGINGDFLAPTIKVSKGDKVAMNVFNKLGEVTSLHWHGLWNEGQNDGTAHQSFDDGKSWHPKFDINNRASTAWYHPHPHGATATQVYQGIAGMIIVDDKNSKTLDIPKEYGVDDIPLVVQDRYFNDNGDMVYFDDFRTHMMGMMGNTFIVNGVHQPVLKAKKTILRFRILNGSNASVWNMKFSDDREFYQIATDGGFLQNPVSMKNIVLSPAERAEIIVDISDKSENLYFQNYNPMLSSKYVDVFQIDATRAKKSSHKMPNKSTKLATIKKIDPKSATVFRDMKLDMGRGGLSINNKTMDMHRIDEQVKLGATEIWTIIGGDRGMSHPFHIHGASFLILSRNGELPPKNEQGWKDVVNVRVGEVVKIIMTFKYKADKNNPYMYHCHILEHEDMGMMGQFSVT